MKDIIDKIETILVTVGQRDRRFKLGETIRYSPSEVAKILREHKDELEADGILLARQCYVHEQATEEEPTE